MAVKINRSLRLPASQCFPGPKRKSGIALHHTVGGSAESTIWWWREDRTRGRAVAHGGGPMSATPLASPDRRIVLTDAHLGEIPHASTALFHASIEPFHASIAAFEAWIEAFHASNEASEAWIEALHASIVAFDASTEAFHAAVVAFEASIEPVHASDTAFETALDASAALPLSPGVPVAAPPPSQPTGKEESIMARFPQTEAEVAALAQDIIAGLTAHTEDFPAPPAAPAELQTALAEYVAAREAAIVGAAAAAQGTAAKDDALQGLMDLMKADLRYAENVTRFDDGKLQLLGWGGRRSRTANDLPGQARTLEVLREGDGWVFLDWKEPVDGGKVAAYRVQRRRREDGPWTDAGMAVESEITLNNQEKGVEFEYHVIAVNKAGEGPPSNIVRAVL